MSEGKDGSEGQPPKRTGRNAVLRMYASEATR